MIHREETEFSRQMATLSADGKSCWICLLPLGTRHDHAELLKSRDHVVPQMDGGNHLTGNIRWAHRWCNSTRGHHPLSLEIIRRCREYVLGHHANWLVHSRQYAGPLEIEHPEAVRIAETCG